jgi:hypothetical protein
LRASIIKRNPGQALVPAPDSSIDLMILSALLADYCQRIAVGFWITAELSGSQKACEAALLAITRPFDADIPLAIYPYHRI